MANVRRMHEFSSISVSAFEADSLAARLTEQSAEGWDVVSVVTADSKIIAYLRREAAAPAAEPVEAVEAVAGDETSPAFVAAATTPVEEPAGWAAEPEPAAAAATDTAAAAAAAAAVVAEPALPASTPVAEPAVEPVAAEPVAAVAEPVAAVAEPVAQPAQQQTAVAPAGWYADPSGRYELRYWDGTQWTEHVSRAGQQFTDPPVA
jgi:Protein of unknown function (DUF2510)